MSWIQRKAAHCDVCEHEWLSEGYPKRCAKCKSMKWNVGYPVGRVAKIEEETAYVPCDGLVYGAGENVQNATVESFRDVAVLEKEAKESRGKSDVNPEKKPCPRCEETMVPWGPDWHCFGCNRNY